MEITPEQLLHLRKERRLTRQELALELGCSAGAIVQWEGRKRSIPAWVADKMYATLPLHFSIQELAEIFELCQQLGCSMIELLQNSVRANLHQHSKSQTQAVNARPVKIVVSPSTVTPLPLQQIIAAPSARPSARPAVQAATPTARPKNRKDA